MSHGRARRAFVKNLGELADLISALSQKEAITLGQLAANLPDDIDVVTEAKLNGGSAIARTAKYLTYPANKPGLLLIDHDTKGMPDEVRERLRAAGGFWSALVSVCPALAKAGCVERASTSAGLYRSDTGEKFKGSDGRHIFIVTRDGNDAERFLSDLHDRCTLAGFGWGMIGDAGQFLERSIVDKTVGRPERPVFEGKPVLKPPLEQDAEARRAKAIDGGVLDTVIAWAPLTVVEKSRLQEIHTKERARLSVESNKKRKAYILKNGDTLSAKLMCMGLLLPDVVLPFDDAKFEGHTVGVILEHPQRYVGATLADPIEGIAYGRCKAYVNLRSDGTPFILSLAHGCHTIFRLCYGKAVVLTKMQAADKDKRVDVFLYYAARAELEAGEIEELVGVLAKDKLITKARATKLLKEAKAELQDERQQQKKEEELAERCDPRPRLDCPLYDAEWLPVMAPINEVLAASKDVMPPMRDSDGNLVTARMRRIAKMHAFETANEVDKDHEYLPPPDTLLLTKLSLQEAGELIEKHIEYVRPKDRRSVHLPNEFVQHYMQRDDGVLPVVMSVATMPIVRADGSVIGQTSGLDRDRGTIFHIQPEITALVPRRDTCDDDAVKEAMNFLMNDWLVDVAGNYATKSIILSEALAMLERLELESRPVYNHTAAIPASGKTTLLKMLSLAVSGTPPAAAPWSFNLEERRKAPFAYLLKGAGGILWDNIPAGSVLWCPNVERSCTTRIYADRLLGSTKTLLASSAVIHQFTGNNITLTGDLATRGLEARLDTDRPDPQNRKFTHNNPLAWTMQHRARILKSLYTLLLGNPLLKQSLDAEVPTRFKEWMRLCGSAVEHGAAIHLGGEGRAVAEGVVFDDMFKKQVEESTSTVSQVGMMEALLTYIEDNQRQLAESKDQGAFMGARRGVPIDALTAGEIAERLNTPTNDAADLTLREFWFKDVNFQFTKVSPKQVGMQLRSYRDTIVLAGDEHTLSLKRSADKYNNNTERVWRVERRTKDGKVVPRVPPAKAAFGAEHF